MLYEHLVLSERAMRYAYVFEHAMCEGFRQNGTFELSIEGIKEKRLLMYTSTYLTYSVPIY